MSYSEKLKHPKWQKKRLEILERDEFTCKNCGDSSSELHVHHIKYVFNTEIWDYENQYLITLCKVCHNKISELKKDVKHRIDIDFVYSDELDEISYILEIIETYNPFDLMQIRKLITKYNDKRLSKLLKNG